MKLDKEGIKMKYIECLFIGEGSSISEISGIKGIQVFSNEKACEYVDKQLQAGITYFLIFAVPIVKSIEHAIESTFCVSQFISKVKNLYGDRVTLIADVGLSPYQDSGQSVIYQNNTIDELASYDAASQLSLAFSEAGVDYVAPCLSLPKQVEKIKLALNQKNYSTRIMSYSLKFSSSLYGAYRQTIGSNMGTTRKNYQSDYTNSDSALTHMCDDLRQGADIVIVKPAVHYLDIIFQVKNINHKCCVAAYHVSGEFMMAKQAAETGLIDEDDYFDEVHASIYRAGANFIIGYAATEFIRWKTAINEKSQ
ncbi:hypothetical protein [Shewanella surugensis]|uniref:Delta-aminolevulinic acid dehydratase n=1 Tax=Shewanella surugensis TaxID=212020 RepID=A0ABT0LAJ2_9GAMM|nr:hypothetical protein [Shewanella surugensis]MCL1124729.1 hypothetical protein [Shewanella surugensis]